MQYADTEAMQSAAEIIKHLGGPTKIAAFLRIPMGTVSSWGSRNSIPAEYWAPLARLAAEHGVKGLTVEEFASRAALRGASATAE